MPRRKHWRTIAVAKNEYHWKVCPLNFESCYPAATDPCKLAIESEQQRGKVLRVRFPYDPASRVTATPRMTQEIINAAVGIGWSVACSEPRYWLGDSLASYAQWVDRLRSSGR
jgi:hypothetical protein